MIIIRTAMMKIPLILILVLIITITIIINNNWRRRSVQTTVFDTNIVVDSSRLANVLATLRQIRHSTEVTSSASLRDGAYALINVILTLYEDLLHGRTIARGRDREFSSDCECKTGGFHEPASRPVLRRGIM